MRKKYSAEELRALHEIFREFGPIKYVNAFDLEREFFVRTGVQRATAPLYMAYWRLQHGYYDHLLSA